MNYQALAFFTGLFGSVHCLVMCGPLMFAMPFYHNSRLNTFIQTLLYQTGRIAVYSLLGLIAGAFGRGFMLIGLQSIISIISGAGLILAALFHFFPAFVKGFKLNMQFSSSIGNIAARHFSKPYGSFVAGAFNGILPCGMVYMALAGALNGETLKNSAAFMFYFGLGTCPLMLLSALLPLFFRRRFNTGHISYYLFLIVGIWLVVRGFGVSIGENGLECR